MEHQTALLFRLELFRSALKTEPLGTEPSALISFRLSTSFVNDKFMIENSNKALTYLQTLR